MPRIAGSTRVGMYLQREKRPLFSISVHMQGPVPEWMTSGAAGDRARREEYHPREIKKEIGSSGIVESPTYLTLKASAGPEKKGLCTDRDHVVDLESLWARGSVVGRLVERPDFWLGKWIGFPVKILLPSIGQHRLLRSRSSRSGVGGLWNGSDVGGRSERREQPRGESAGFLVVEPKNAWAGKSESNQDAGWNSRAWKS